MLEHLTRQGVTGRLELVLVDRGVTAAAARTLGRSHDLELRRVGWDDKQPVFRPIRHAWRVEVAQGRLGRSRRLAKSFENTTSSATGWLHVACVATTLRHLTKAPARSRHFQSSHEAPGVRPRRGRCGCYWAREELPIGPVSEGGEAFRQRAKPEELRPCPES